MANFRTYLNRVLGKLWKKQLDYIITGECGCTKLCRIYYADPEKIVDCDKYGDTRTIYGYQKECNYDMVYEDISLAVLTDSKKFINTHKLISRADGAAQTICDKETFVKLKQSVFVILDYSENGLMQNKFVRNSDGESLGFVPNQYYSLMWKKV